MQGEDRSRVIRSSSMKQTMLVAVARNMNTSLRGFAFAIAGIPEYSTSSFLRQSLTTATSLYCIDPLIPYNSALVGLSRLSYSYYTVSGVYGLLRYFRQCAKMRIVFLGMRRPRDIKCSTNTMRYFHQALCQYLFVRDPLDPLWSKTACWPTLLPSECMD